MRVTSLWMVDGSSTNAQYLAAYLRAHGYSIKIHHHVPSIAAFNLLHPGVPVSVDTEIPAHVYAEGRLRVLDFLPPFHHILLAILPSSLLHRVHPLPLLVRVRPLLKRILFWCVVSERNPLLLWRFLHRK